MKLKSLFTRQQRLSLHSAKTFFHFIFDTVHVNENITGDINVARQIGPIGQLTHNYKIAKVLQCFFPSDLIPRGCPSDTSSQSERNMEVTHLSLHCRVGLQQFID